MSLLITHLLTLCTPIQLEKKKVFHKDCIIFSSRCTKNSKHCLISLAFLMALIMLLCICAH